MTKVSQIISGASKFEDSLAYVSPSGHLQSYKQLSQTWENLKLTLIDNGCLNQKRIGILLPTKINCIECIGAILLSKNVYVPLDFNAPLSRNLHIIQDNSLHALFIGTDLYKEHHFDLPKHEIGFKTEDYLLILFQEVREINNIPEDLAYILNTSGSTGKPKGVMIRHENAMAFINWASENFEFSTTDKFTSIAPFHFDLSIFDIYVSLKCRGSVLLFEPEDIKNPLLLAKLIAEKGVTVIYATPTILMLILRYGKLHKYDFRKLRYVFFAGEVFPVEPLKKLMDIWSTAQFFNWYGPTETNVCTYQKILRPVNNQEKPFPIGRECLPNTTKVAEDGELLVTGSLVTPGYWNNPEKNEMAFTIDPNGARWYKTGDLVEVDENGAYVFKGRKDRMIKRRGYRIELDEIENIFRNHPLVESAAVLSKFNDKDIKVIIGFYSLKNDNEQLALSDIREYLLSYLPMYMLPDQFKEVEALPKTSTHKTDYQTLTKLEFK